MGPKVDIVYIYLEKKFLFREVKITLVTQGNARGQLPGGPCGTVEGEFDCGSSGLQFGHSKAFDYPVMGHWGKVKVVSFSGARGTRTNNLLSTAPLRPP